MVWQSLLSHSMRQKGDTDDTQQCSPLVTPIKSEQIFDMYFDTIFYWYWRGVHNIEYSSAFQEIRARAVLSQKLSHDPSGLPIRSNTTEPRLTVVHFSFTRECDVWALRVVSVHSFSFMHSHMTSVLCVLMTSLFRIVFYFIFFFTVNHKHFGSVSIKYEISRCHIHQGDIL